MSKSAFDHLNRLSNDTRISLAEENMKSETLEEKVEDNKDKNQGSNEMEEQQFIFNRREQRSHGNRYVHVTCALLKSFINFTVNM